MSRRAPETLSDYVVVAICPTLIGLLVGSLMFFLIEVFYPFVQGEFKLRLMYVMALFVMAVVCIARISMTFGMERASLYALPIAILYGIAMARFVPLNPLVNWALMGLVWWATHKLTWDCTLVDDTQDASGQGLLQQMGLDPAAGRANSPPGTTAPAAEAEGTTRTDMPDKPWWEKWLEPDRRPHAPGVWVVYFSLAALPIFGVGGWYVSAADPEARSRVFRLLVLYVACGMALLLATSFLGLRRYLRQRKLEMPLEMTAVWIAAGSALILSTLVVAAILPRPHAEHSLSRLPFTIAQAVHRASRYAVGPEGTEDPSPDERLASAAAQEGQEATREGDRGGKTQRVGSSRSPAGRASEQGDSGADDKASSRADSGSSPGQQSFASKSGGRAGSDKRGSSDGQEAGSKRADSQGDRKAAERDAEGQPRRQDAAAAKNQNRQPETGSPARSWAARSLSEMASQVMQGITTILRWLFYVALLIAGVVFAWVYRDQLVEAWQKLLQELRELWESWFGEPSGASDAALPAAEPSPPRPFSAFVDPFASGAAAHLAWPDLVQYTFAAVEAWAREHDCPRAADQTPLEFAQALGSVEPDLAMDARSLAGWYSQLAYAPRAAAPHTLDPLRRLWRQMEVLHDVRAA